MREQATLLGGDAADGRAVSVLLVEDHAAVREALAERFAREAGFESSRRRARWRRRARGCTASMSRSWTSGCRTATAPT
jgi:hypothetical protein